MILERFSLFRLEASRLEEATAFSRPRIPFTMSLQPRGLMSSKHSLLQTGRSPCKMHKAMSAFFKASLLICRYCQSSLPRTPTAFSYCAQLILNFSPDALLGSKAHPRPPGLTPLNNRQLEALALLQTLAEKHCLKFAPQVGDLHFFNNLALLHRRDTIELEPNTRRHLVRMALRSSTFGRSLPQVLDMDRWGDESRKEDCREEVWHIEPMPDIYFPLKRFSN